MLVVAHNLCVGDHVLQEWVERASETEDQQSGQVTVDTTDTSGSQKQDIFMRVLQERSQRLI